MKTETIKLSLSFDEKVDIYIALRDEFKSELERARILIKYKMNPHSHITAAKTIKKVMDELHI